MSVQNHVTGAAANTTALNCSYCPICISLAVTAFPAYANYVFILVYCLIPPSIVTSSTRLKSILVSKLLALERLKLLLYNIHKIQFHVVISSEGEYVTFSAKVQ